MRNLPRRVTKNAQRFVYNGYLQIANFRSATTTSDYNYFVWDPIEPVATRPLVWFTLHSIGEGGDFSTIQSNFQTFKPSNLQTSLPTVQSNFQTFKPSNLQTSLSTVQPFNCSTAYYTHDGNKNVSEVIVADSCVAAHYEYAPFGAVTVSNGAEQNVGSSTSIHCSLLPIRCLNPWRFSSEFADDELGCDYYNYREYEPVIGRWMSMDLVEGKDAVLFVDNSPVSKLDRIGLYGNPVSGGGKVIRMRRKIGALMGLLMMNVQMAQRLYRSVTGH